MDQEPVDSVGEVTDSLCIVGECEIIRKDTHLLMLSSVWPGKIATTDEIEAERKNVEMLHSRKLKVWEVTYPTFSGVLSTKVRWLCV